MNKEQPADLADLSLRELHESLMDCLTVSADLWHKNTKPANRPVTEEMREIRKEIMNRYG